MSLPDVLRTDLVFARRLFWRERSAAAAIIACLSLGIGATTTVFAVADRIFLRPLPFANADRVVSIATVRDGITGTGGASLPDLIDWGTRARSLSKISGYNAGLVTLVGETPQRVSSALVRGDLFGTLGVVPLRGRTLLDSDMREGAPNVLMLREGLATTMFGSVERALGDLVQLEDDFYAVVGVIAERDRFPEEAEVWLPIRRPLNGARSNRFLHVIGGLRSGESLASARGDMQRITRGLATEYPAENAAVSVRVEPLRERYVSRARAAFPIMAAAALLVLLVACANVASLQLSRGESRIKELSVRAAIGASKARLVLQLLVENIVLASVGGLLGIAISAAATRVVAIAVAGSVPPWMDFAPGPRTAVFVVGVSAGALILVGLTPALRLSRSVGAGLLTLRTGASGTLDPGSRLFRRALIAGQLAASLALLTGAALAIQSVVSLLRVESGFRPGGLLAFRVGARGERYATEEARNELLRRVLEEVGRLPGVQAVGATTQLPLRECCTRLAVQVEGNPVAEGRAPDVVTTQISSRFLATAGVSVLQGREFAEHDDARGPRVAIVSESFAKRHVGSGNALGRRIQIEATWWTIVGVAADVRQAGLVEEVEPQVYRPLAQRGSQNFSVIARFDSTAARSAFIERDLRAALSRAAPFAPPTGILWMADVIESSIFSQRLYGGLLVAFAAAAGFLAVIGLYSMAAAQVARRRTELGIRAALGASPASLRRLVLSEGVAVAGCGLLGGSAASVVVAIMLSRALPAISLHDPTAYVAALGCTLFAVVLALGLPSRTAARTSPLHALLPLAMCAIVLPTGSDAQSTSPGRVTFGPYAVGFRAVCDTAGRSAPDREQLLVWYPARHPAGAVPMAVSEYFAPSRSFDCAGPPATPEERRAIVDAFARQIINDGGVPGEPEPIGGKLFPNDSASGVAARLAATMTRAYPAADAVTGSFPIVVFMPAGAIEQSVLLESLASHGYIVVTFPHAGAPRDGQIARRGAQSGPTRDLIAAAEMGRAIDAAVRLGNADGRRVAVMASGGYPPGAIWLHAQTGRLSAIIVGGRVPRITVAAGAPPGTRAPASRPSDDSLPPTLSETWQIPVLDWIDAEPNGNRYTRGLLESFTRAERITVTSRVGHANTGGIRRLVYPADTIASKANDMLGSYVHQFLAYTLQRRTDASAFFDRAPEANGIPPGLLAVRRSRPGG